MIEVQLITERNPCAQRSGATTVWMIGN